MNRARSLLAIVSMAVMLGLLGACGDTGDSSHDSAWPVGVERVWIGPEYFANRLADWKLKEGRLECVEADQKFPLRTVFLLTRSLRSADGSFSMRVRSGAVEANRVPAAESFAGFLDG